MKKNINESIEQMEEVIRKVRCGEIPVNGHRAPSYHGDKEREVTGEQDSCIMK